MSIIQHTHVPAGWYPDGVAEDSLRWWDGEDWTNDVRSSAAPILVPVLPIEVEYVPGQSLPVELDDDAPVQLPTTSALSRRQLREMLGGPLVTEAPTDQ